jgi:Type II CAAX prenyl endopeptidase Rce1-like
MAEELLFRGLLFWALVTLLLRMHFREPPAQLISVLLIALAFAGAHIGRAGVSSVCTILTGGSFGAMRVCVAIHGCRSPHARRLQFRALLADTRLATPARFGVKH